MNVIECNGYHVPTSSIFYVNSRAAECTVAMAVGADQFTFSLSAAQLRPILEQAGFIPFNAGGVTIYINPKNVTFLRQTDTVISITGPSGRILNLQGQENIDRALEIFYPKKKAK